jgi:hypothetical protein
MNNDLERIWKETVLAYLKVLSRHFDRRTEENKKMEVKIGGLRAEI